MAQQPTSQALYRGHGVGFSKAEMPYGSKPPTALAVDSLELRQTGRAVIYNTSRMCLCILDFNLIVFCGHSAAV